MTSYVYFSYFERVTFENAFKIGETRRKRAGSRKMHGSKLQQELLVAVFCDKFIVKGRKF